MRNYFEFGGLDSRNFGVYISGQGTFRSPQREYNFLSVPGRNGDLIGTERKFQNAELTYPAFIYSNFKQNISDFRNALNSLVGYQRLTDSYHTDEFRMAVYSAEFEPDVVPMNNAGEFEITFNCKPQRYLLTGETAIELTADGTITNPTLFDAQPLIVVTGRGDLGINSQTVTITGITPVTIDCEMMDCYQGAYSRNDTVSFSDYKFPVLVPGVNNITISGNISKVVITPRWWRL